jgi:Tfp pilus assembly protein FimV
MTRKRRRWLVTSALSMLLVPTAASSLSLGELKLLSYLHEPLQAVIPIQLNEQDILEEVQVQLASREDFKRFAIPRSSALSSLQFELVSLNRSHAQIQVTTDESIKELFLDFLIEVTSSQLAGGRLVKECTLLLDPRHYEVVAKPAPRAPSPTSPPVLAHAPDTRTARATTEHTSGTQWYVQLGSFRNPYNATRLLDKLLMHGYRAFLDRSNVNGQTRVRIGPFSDLSAAKQLGNSILAAEGIQGWITAPRHAP